MIETDRFEQVEAVSAADLRAWLETHHAQDESVWLVTWKKHVPGSYLSREAVLDELIAFGWTDGVRRVLDDDRTMQLISRRRQQTWARTYQQRAERLEAEGRMAEPGRDAIARAKSLGQWNAFAHVDDLLVPDDLAAALASDPVAAAQFAATAPSYRRNVLRWIAIAVKPATRATRVAAVTAHAARGEKIPQFQKFHRRPAHRG